MDRHDTKSVFVLRQYLSDGNRREAQLLSLNGQLNIQAVRQEQGNNFPLLGPRIQTVRKPINPSRIFRILRMPRVKVCLDGLYFPSPTVLYVRRAQKILNRLIGDDLRKGKDVCLITPVPPHDLVLAGLGIKRAHPKVRWIVDWQDLWTHDQYYCGSASDKWRKKVRKLEREALHSADANVFTNENGATFVQKDHSLPDDKVYVIPHAYEHSVDATRELHALPDDRALRIGFLGSLFKPPKVPGEKAIEAIEFVRKSGVAIEFHIYGDKYLEKVSRAPIEGRSWIVAHDRVAHDESLRCLSSCDLLLLVLGDVPESRTILHAKLPFYLAENKPILAIVPGDSAVAHMIRETGTGCVVPAEEDWNASLSRAIAEATDSSQSMYRNDEEIKKYSWECVSEQWLSVIQ